MNGAFSRETPVDHQRWDQLVAAALEVQARAYAPYSRFFVGAALLVGPSQQPNAPAPAGPDEVIVTGCNVENASYGLTMCAERVAVTTAVGAGYRHFRAAVVVGPTASPTAPCGACRQVLREFAADLPILLVSAVSGQRTLVSLATLLPGAFDAEDLAQLGHPLP